jgi:hypothetical protein
MAVRDLSLLTTASRRNLNSTNLLWSNLYHNVAAKDVAFIYRSSLYVPFFT